MRVLWLKSWLCFLLLTLLERTQGQMPEITLNYPHFPIRAQNHFQEWTVIRGNSDTFVYPAENVTTFSAYQFFVNEFNFQDGNSGSFFIGAKNMLYEMDQRLNVIRNFSWPVNTTNAASCASVSIDDNFACHNHIRAYRKLPQSAGNSRLLVCGTDAYAPKCRTLDAASINDTTEASNAVSSNNVGFLSIHPFIPALWDFQDETRLFATGFNTFNMWSSYDFARYNMTYNSVTKQLDVNTTVKDRTLQPSDDFQIREPYHPVSIHKVDLQNNPDFGMYLIFFRERDFNAQDSIAAPARSRVIRICKNDRSVEARFFGSLVKAEIVCSKQPLGTPESFGAQTVYYSALRGTHLSTVPSRWYGNQNVWHELMYGIFSGEQFASNGSAICVYFAGVRNVNDPSRFLDGTHKGVFEIFNQNHYLSRIDGEREPHSFLDCNAANNRVKPGLFSAESGIQQYRGLYLPLMEMIDEVFTKVVVDRACVVRYNDTGKCLMQDVLFVGTNGGKIYKIVFSTKTSLYPGRDQLGPDGVTHDPIIVQEWELADNRRVEQLSLRIEDGRPYIYASTYSRVYKISASNCDRNPNCRDCLASRDPYCLWNSTGTGSCVFNTLNSSNSAEVTVPSNLHQNIHSVNSTLCDADPFCDVSVSPHSPIGYEITYTCDGNTISRSVSISARDCATTPLNFTLNSSPQIINDSSILGNNKHLVVFTATSSNGNVSSYPFYVETVNGAPIAPVASEVVASADDNEGYVQVIVTIEGCHLQSEPEDTNICVTFISMNESSFMSCQGYDGMNVFTAGPFYPCENVNYTVYVTNSYGVSPNYAGTVSPRVIDPGAPVSPSIVSVTESTATCSWSQPSTTDTNYCNETAYSIFINSVKRRDCSVIDTLFTIDGLTPYTNFTFGVSACSSGGESVMAETSSVTACSAPSRVRNLRTDASNTQRLQFNWDEPSIMNGSNLQYNIVEECYNFTTVTTDEEQFFTSQRSHIISSLQPRTQCCITVYANSSCDSIHFVSEPTIACATTSDDIPGPVEDLSAIPSSPRSVFLRWAPPLNYTSPGVTYVITVRRTDDPSDSRMHETFNQLYYHALDLEENTGYSFSVTSRNEIGDGESIEVSNTTLPSFPDAPVNVNLSFTNCMLTVTWEDPTSDRYSVDSYFVLVQCNRATQNRTVPVSTNSASFDVCEGSTPLSWCSAQVYGENDVGRSDLSQWTSVVVPIARPVRPQCYMTENLGSSVSFSFTLSTPYALDSLSLDYSLTSMALTPNDVETRDNLLFTSLSNNTLTFNSLFRNTPYLFRLRLCDRNTNIPATDQCSEYCEEMFNASSIRPAPPRDVKAIPLFERIIVSWSSPLNENASIFAYSVKINGKTQPETTSTNLILSNLTADSDYQIAVLARDTRVNISSFYSDDIMVTTLTGKPGSVRFVTAVFDTNQLSLTVLWGPPIIANGTLRNYTVLWMPNNDIDDCYVAEGRPDSSMETVPNTDVLSKTFSNAQGFSSDVRSFLICIAAMTSASRGDWNRTTITRDGGLIIGAFTDSNTSPDRTGLILVSVIAVMAIVAAVVIVVVFLVICRWSLKADGNESKSSKGLMSFRKAFSRSSRKKARTPDRSVTQSVRSTYPLCDEANGEKSL